MFLFRYFVFSVYLRMFGLAYLPYVVIVQFENTEHFETKKIKHNIIFRSKLDIVSLVKMNYPDIIDDFDIDLIDEYGRFIRLSDEIEFPNFDSKKKTHISINVKSTVNNDSEVLRISGRSFDTRQGLKINGIDLKISEPECNNGESQAGWILFYLQVNQLNINALKI